MKVLFSVSFVWEEKVSGRKFKIIMKIKRKSANELMMAIIFCFWKRLFFSSVERRSDFNFEMRRIVKSWTGRIANETEMFTASDESMSFSKLLAEAYFKNWTKYGMYGKRRKMNKTERGMIFFIFFEIKTIMYWIKNRKKSEMSINVNKIKLKMHEIVVR